MGGLLFTNDSRISIEQFNKALGKLNYNETEYSSKEYYRYKVGSVSLRRGKKASVFSNNRYVIVMTGSIYNLKQLSKQYQIHEGIQSDAEILLELYINLGANILNYLNGMFAFIILDTVQDQCFVARDRIGGKPLYYINTGTYFTFSSEISSLLYLSDSVQFDQFSIRQYRKLRACFNQRTIYKGIYMFPPGSYMFNGKIHKYWSYSTDFKEIPSDEELTELINSAILLRVEPNQSIGSLLSGGLDSTIVTALSGARETWTVGLKEQNEFKWSDLAAKHLGTNHNKLIVTPESFIQLSKEIIQLSGDVISVPNEVFLYYLMKKARERNSILLCGEGADELFFGYDRIFRWANQAKRWDIEEFSLLYSYGSHEDLEVVEDAVGPFLNDKSPINIVSSFFQVAHIHSLLRRLDRASTISGVEARGPFLDYKLIERMSGVPFSYRMKQGEIKSPLKQIFRNIVPQEIIERPKVGFPVKLEMVLDQGLKGETYTDKWFEYNLQTLEELL